jgi:hypothetical protein
MNRKDRAPRQNQAIDKEIKKAFSYFKSMRIQLSVAASQRKKAIFEPKDLEEEEMNDDFACKQHASACNAFESHKEITMLYDQCASESLDYVLNCVERLKNLSATEEEIAPIWADFQKHQMMLAH